MWRPRRDGGRGCSVATPVVTAKAVKLLAEERVRFSRTDGPVVATVHGDNGDYEVRWDGRSWSCACDCSHSRCAHITACEIVIRAFGIPTR